MRMKIINMNIVFVLVLFLKACTFQLSAQSPSKIEIDKFEEKVNNNITEFPIELNKNDSIIVQHLLLNDIDRLRKIVSTHVLNWCILINKSCEIQVNIRLTKHLFNDSPIILKLFEVDIFSYEDIFDTGNYMDVIAVYYSDNSDKKINKLLLRNNKLIDICVETNGLNEE